MQLYLNKDFHEKKIIPVVKKFDAAFKYTLFTPYADLDQILSLKTDLDKHSHGPVEIIDVTQTYCEGFLDVMGTKQKGWQKVKTSDDVIQNATTLSELKGRDFSSLRNTLKHVRVDLKPLIVPLSKDTKDDAISVFNEWKEMQGKKYFRVTVGRDVRLIEEYFDKTDQKDFFSCVYYVDNKAVACNYGCRSAKNPEWGQDVTVKANINYKGMGDFAFIHLMQMMHDKGINYVNDSGGTGKVKQNKMKFDVIKTIPTYNLSKK